MNFSAISDYNGDGRFVQHAKIMLNISKLTFRPDDEVLDVGCGTGNETKSIAAMVKGMTGIDSSKEMIDIACQNNSAPNITYCLGDAQTVGDNPDWRERFHKVVCFFVLHWVPDVPKALKSILACLKPGGEALIIVANRTTLFEDAVSFLSNHPRWCGYTKGYKSLFTPWNQTIAENEELFNSCGWTNVKSELQCHEKLSEMRAKLYCKTLFGETDMIPDMEQGEYLDDLWHWMLSRYEDKSQVRHINLPTEVMVIHAYKQSS